MSTIRKHDNPLVVSIRCLTYNHSSYIRQCLEGFIMQKTNFRFEAIIHDDASTDGTAEIIREYAKKYPDIIKPIYEKENQYSKHNGSISAIMDKHMNGKYIAFCEGDDYWTDPYKLQKQVDILNKNKDIGLVYSSIKRYIEPIGKFEKLGPNYNKDFEDLIIKGNLIHTATVCIRTCLFFGYRKDIPYNPNWQMGDYPLWMYISLKSKIHYIPEVTGVYRILTNSASHSTDYKKNISFIHNAHTIANYFIEYASRDDLKNKNKVLFFNLIVSTYIFYGMKVPYQEIKDLWTWNFKIILKFFCSYTAIGRWLILDLYKKTKLL